MSLCARLRCSAMGDCARPLFVCPPTPTCTPTSLLIALKSAWQFGSMAQAPQEQPSDKMSPRLCSMHPIGWPGTLYTWEPEGQSTEWAQGERGGALSCLSSIRTHSLHCLCHRRLFVNWLPLSSLTKSASMDNYIRWVVTLQLLYMIKLQINHTWFI